MKEKVNHPAITNTSFLIFLGACLFSFASCATTPRTVFYKLNKMEKLSGKSLKKLLWENEMGSEEDHSSTVIVRSDLASYHLVQLRGSEKNHLHEFHDLVVFVQSGSGVMFLGKESFRVSAGSIVFIPHGVPHYMVSSGSDPTVAVLVFSPSFDGNDVLYDK